MFNKIMTRRCYLCKRKQNVSKNIVLHTFPKDKAVCQSWKKICGLNPNQVVKGLNICCIHFTPQDYKRTERNGVIVKHLNGHAVPTLKITHSPNKDTETEVEVAPAILPENNMLPATFANGGDVDNTRKQKISHLLKLHIHNFQKTIILSRRRSQQRIRDRQRKLREVFINQLMEMQKNYIEMFCVLVGAQHTQEEPTETTPNDIPFERVMHHFNEEQWLHSLRTTRRTFYWICEQLDDTLQKYPIVDKTKLSIELHVALALYTLAHTGEHNTSTIAELFGVPSELVYTYLEQFARALLQKLGHVLLTLPKHQPDYNEIRLSFQHLSNMPPAIVGVIGVCTLPIANETNANIRMECLIDDRMLFRKLQIFSKPTQPLFSEDNNEITELPHQQINGRKLPCFVLAPVKQRYPLRPWLLQRYVDPIAPHEYDFNEAADNVYNISEQALQRLFSRWQFLGQPFELSSDASALIITAGCALHNLLEELSEPFLQEWCEPVDIREFMRGACTPKPDSCTLAEYALDIRDFLARTISSTEI